MGLNAAFKQAAAQSSQDEYLRLRKALERYGEEQLMPCVRSASQSLAVHPDPSLTRQLMALLVSYDNAADETLSYAVARLFAVDPAAVEHAYRSFGPDDRRRMAERIRAGWTNVRPELRTALRRPLDARLDCLLR